MHEDVRKEFIEKYNKKVNEVVDMLSKKLMEADIEAYNKTAKLMVAEMADCYISGYMSNCDEDEQEGIDRWMANARHEAMELGLLLPE